MYVVAHGALVALAAVLLRARELAEAARAVGARQEDVDAGPASVVGETSVTKKSGSQKTTREYSTLTLTHTHTRTHAHTQ